MKRIAILATTVAALSLVAVSGAASRGHEASATTIQTRHTAVGTILTTSRGLTIYAFGRDSRNHDRCAGISGCTSVWHLVKTTGRPIAGHGVSRALLGTIRVGKVTQATYAGRPLYTFVEDSGPGTGYVGVKEFGGAWDAISPNGKLVM